MEIKFVYNQNGTEVEKEFEDYLDLVEFVALNKVRDEDFVSMKLDDEEITGGINGLALFALNQVHDAREYRAAMAAAMESEEEFDDDEEYTMPEMDNIQSAYNDMVDAFDELMAS